MFDTTDLEQATPAEVTFQLMRFNGFQREFHIIKSDVDISCAGVLTRYRNTRSSDAAPAHHGHCPKARQHEDWMFLISLILPKFPHTNEKLCYSIKSVRIKNSLCNVISITYIFIKQRTNISYPFECLED